jgi:hypothetical protein
VYQGFGVFTTNNVQAHIIIPGQEFNPRSKQMWWRMYRKMKPGRV